MRLIAPQMPRPAPSATTEEKKYTDDGEVEIVEKQTLIFPRYHQLDVVRKLIADVKEQGSGNNYLIQHSAGSGKSNSIAWTAYRLASLHDENNNAIFSSVVVVTNRTVLDADKVPMEHHRKRGSERCPACDPKRVGRRKRVREKPLERRARAGKPRPGGEREKDAGKAHLENHCSCHDVPAPAEKRIGKRADNLEGRKRVPADSEAENDRNRNEQERGENEQRADFFILDEHLIFRKPHARD